jgi:hypothetical protein
MLTNDMLGMMTVRSVIFHDVPNQRGDGGPSVVLATDITQIDNRRRRLLQDKLKRVLSSRSAYGIIFAPETSSPVPDAVRNFTTTGHGAASFIDMSQELARHLHQVQHGAVSPGLLCVIDFVASGHRGLVLMKLEREEAHSWNCSEKTGARISKCPYLTTLC